MNDDPPEWGRIRPVCKKNSRCQKRTILSVSNLNPNQGRFYWKCSVHGWSEWCNGGDYTQTEQGGDYMHATLLSEYVPRNVQQQQQQFEAEIEEESTKQDRQPFRRRDGTTRAKAKGTRPLH